MTLYITFLILVLFSCKTKLNKSIIFIFFILIMNFLTGLRSEVIGNDSIPYAKVFEEINYNNFSQIYMEKGFLLYNLAIKNITNKVWVYFFITSSLTYFGIYNFIKKNSLDVLYSLFLFITLRDFGSTMNIIRQMLALSVILIGFEFLKKEKKIIFFILNCIAISIHYSAITCILLPFLKKIRFKTSYLWSIIITCLTFIFFYKKILLLVLKIPLLTRYKNYLDSKYFTGWNLSTIFLTIVYLIIMVSYFKIFVKGKESDNLKNLKMWICTLSFLFSAFSLIGSLIARLGIYYSFFYIIIIPEIISGVKNKILLRFIITVFCIVYYLVTMFLKPEWNNIYPYKFFWSN